VKSVGLCLSAGVALACAASPSPPPPKPVPATPQVAPEPVPSAPAPVVAASAERAPTPLPLPDAPPGTDPEEVKLAASICAASYLDKQVGCRSHPPFERPEQLPDGKIIPHQGDPLLFCGIDHVFHGSFTRPGAKQVVISFEQCKEGEDAVWDSGFPGSAVLAEESDGRWKAVGYEPDVNAAGCLQDHRADGRDVLLCQSGLAAPPSGVVRYVFLIDFARGGGKTPSAVSLAKMFGDTLLCAFADQGFPSGLVSLQTGDLALRDLNHDGTDDLVLKVRRGRIPPSAALDAKVKARCKQSHGSVYETDLVPKPKQTTLEFLSKGDDFVPSPGSQKTLAAWAAEAPEDFNGLADVGPPLAGNRDSAAVP
jgi:hypothetical protein